MFHFVKGSIFSFVDRMESIDQTLIKHAAILGMSFPREMLEAIVPHNLQGDRINAGLGRLMEKGEVQSYTQYYNGLLLLYCNSFDITDNTKKTSRTTLFAFSH